MMTKEDVSPTAHHHQLTRPSAWRLLDMAAGAALMLALVLLIQANRPVEPQLPAWYSGPYPACHLVSYNQQPLMGSRNFGVTAAWICAPPVPTLVVPAPHTPTPNHH